MSNILSQEEIDALLGGLTGGELKAAADAPLPSDIPEEVITFNFLNQDRIVRGGMPTLEVVHDRLARLLRTALTQMVRRPVDVQVLNHVEMKLGEFNRMIPSPSSLHTLKMDPLKGLGLLVLPGKLIYTLLDIFFGGSGEDAEKEEARDFTLIEQRIISNVTGALDAAYTESWKPIHPLMIVSSASETNPQFINIAQASDVIVCAEYEIFIDDIRCGLWICLPLTTLEPIRDTLRGTVISESLDETCNWVQRMTASLNEAVVEMRAMLGSASLTVQELVSLKEGDIIQLREDFEHPVEIMVEGVPKFWATVGSHKCVRAIQVTGIQK